MKIFLTQKGGTSFGTTTQHLGRKENSRYTGRKQNKS
jgi:hypothetical protein